MIKIINVKRNNTIGGYANLLIDQEISNSKFTEIRVLIVIHGYGSSGKGGVIKQEVLDHLILLKKFKKIKDFVKGEEWGNLNETSKEMAALFPELILNSQIQNNNAGVSIIWIN